MLGLKINHVSKSGPRKLTIGINYPKQYRWLRYWMCLDTILAKLPYLFWYQYITLGNPFAHLGRNITHPFWYSRCTCSFGLIQPIFIYWRAFPVESRHYIGSILYLRNQPMCFHCFALMYQLTWDSEYNSLFLQRLSSRYRGWCNHNFISVCTLKQNSGGTSSDFTNIKSNRNMSRSDCKYSPV